jgi:cell division protein FtsQ
MSKDAHGLPETRTWRDIPQQVRPRAMSHEGRRRLVMGAIRAAMGAVAVGAVAWGAFEMADVLRENAAAMPDTAKSDRVRSLVLVTDGVLDKNWLARTLAIPGDATLMGLDLIKLRSKILGDAQVSFATVDRNFPDTLTVRISERSPVARLMAKSGADPARMLLVARDGVAFAGTGFDAAMVASLPWLDGVRLVRRGAAIAPIGGMAAVADLLASAKLEAESLYRTWQVVSLARLASDGEIDVYTRGGMRIVFGANENYLRQIARLDLLIDVSSDPTRPLREVNLALGAQVPVSYGTAAPTLAEPAPAPDIAAPARPSIALPAFSSFHIDTHREL